MSTCFISDRTVLVCLPWVRVQHRAEEEIHQKALTFSFPYLRPATHTVQRILEQGQPKSFLYLWQLHKGLSVIVFL